MEIGTFWAIVGSARSDAARSGQPFDEILTGTLAARPRPDIFGFYQRFDGLKGALYRWDVWSAAYLIGGGCSDDGLIAQGRDWYEQAAASPDSLAGHPAVAGDAGDILFYEAVSYAAPRAYERIAGSYEGFYAALDRYRGPGQRPPRDDDANMGEDFDFDDPREMRRRLPRLSAIFLADDAQLSGDARQSRRLLAP